MSATIFHLSWGSVITTSWCCSYRIHPYFYYPSTYWLPKIWQKGVSVARGGHQILTIPLWEVAFFYNHINLLTATFGHTQIKPIKTLASQGLAGWMMQSFFFGAAVVPAFDSQRGTLSGYVLVRRGRRRAENALLRSTIVFGFLIISNGETVPLSLSMIGISSRTSL